MHFCNTVLVTLLAFGDSIDNPAVRSIVSRVKDNSLYGFQAGIICGIAIVLTQYNYCYHSELIITCLIHRGFNLSSLGAYSH